ncbi:molybdenum cofactor guanylyltransferase [Jiella endophytica]|nr:molybdenum cofactor guanylyltransferase [Jiella endophytica]
MTPAGLILAGGRGSRMGGAVPKPLVPLAGRPLILHVVARLERQAAPLILAAPAGAGYDHLNLPLAPDHRPGLPGPLAGIEAGLQALSVMGTAGPDRLFVTPGDTPFLPVDIVERLASTDLDKPVAAVHAGRIQPATAMWPLTVLPDLERWLDEGRPLAIRAFLEAIGHVVAEIPATADAPAGDPFFNVNTPDDLSLAEAFLRRQHGA